MKEYKFYDKLLIICGVFFVMFVVTALLSVAVGRLFPPNSRTQLLAVSSVQSVGIFIIPSLIGAKLAFGNTVKFLRLDVAPPWISLLGVVLAYCILLPFFNQLIYWNENIVFPAALEELGNKLRIFEDNARRATDIILDTNSVGGLLSGVLIVGILTGFSEELFFRGTLQQMGASRGAVHTSIWVTALVFSAFHMQAFGFFPRFLLGAWFGYLLYWTGSIYVPAFAHALNNSVVVVCTWIFPNEEAFDTGMIGVAETGFPMAAFVSAVAFMIFIYYFKDLFFSKATLKYDIQ